jgi:hypothetical protein
MIIPRQQKNLSLEGFGDFSSDLKLLRARKLLLLVDCARAGLTIK